MSVDYPRLVGIIQDRVAQLLPPGSVVIVASKGDEELVRFPGREGWHFPQTPEGLYAGHNPADGPSAAEQLEALRALGGQYFVLPSTAFWWLDHYADFRKHVDSQYQRAFADRSCIIYELQRRSWPARLMKRLRRSGMTWRSGVAAPEPAAGRATAGVAIRPGATARKPGGHLRVALDFPATLPLRPPPGPLDPQHLDLHWVLPDLEQGMGGPMAILRLIQHLERFGHKNTIWIWGATRHADAEAARAFVRTRFLPVEAEVRLLRDDLEQVRGDAVLATHCWTAYPVRAIRNVRDRFYFVQDFEPSFYPAGAEALLAEATYRFGFRGITSSRWLQQLLQARYGVEASRFTYAYDPEIYRAGESPARPGSRVAFYARAKTPRRAVDLGLMALERVAAYVPSLTVDLFGGSVGRLDLPFRAVDHGVLDDRALAELYRGATVGVVLSSTNYSIIPHEMMACGLPVIELDGDGTRAEYPAGTVTLARPTPEGIAAEVERLLTDPALRARQAGRALAYVQGLSWERSARQVEAGLVEALLEGSRRGELPSLPPPSPASPPAFETLPEASDALKVVFAGQPEYYRSSYYDLTVTGDHLELPITSGDPSALRRLPELVEQTGARVCLVFRPEWFAPFPETFREMKGRGVKLIGYSTEPVPLDGFDPHPDQFRRLAELRKALGLDYDLIIHYDPASLETLRREGFERLIAHPLPISRRLFFPEDHSRDFDVCFLGKSTPHREEMLRPLKMRYKVVHVAHGLQDEDARILMNRSKLVLNIHNDRYLNFENRVPQALFCRRPVLSEPLSGDLLLPGRDYIKFDSPGELCSRVAELLRAGEPPPFTPGADLASFAAKALLERLQDILFPARAARTPAPG